MKLNEMADLLTGMASILEKYLKQDAVKDLRTVSDCFRSFSDDNVGTFCSFVVKAKEGKPAPQLTSNADISPKAGDLARQIQNFLDNRDEYDVAGVRQLAAQLNSLRKAEIEWVGEQIRCPVKDTKGKMIAQIENWLVGIKLSADQSSFSLSGSKVG